jgi:hypothetical protein
LLLTLGLIAAAIVPSAFALDGTWIFDDNGLIVDNPYVHSLDHWSHWFTGHFWDVGPDAEMPRQVTFWRPLVLATYSLNWTLGSGSPFAFHLTNLALHAIATLLSFSVLRRWLNASLPAFIATVILAVHPFRAESVAWISGRPDPLMMVGVLMAVQGIALRLRHRRAGLGLELFGTAIAYLSKEHAVVLPLMAIVEVWLASTRGRVTPTAWLRNCGPQVFVAFAYIVLRQFFHPMDTGMGSNWPIWVRVGVVLETLGRYVMVLLCPKDLTLGSALIFLDGHHPRFDTLHVILGGLLICVTVAVGLWALHRKSVVFPALALFVGAMLPISNVVSIGYYVFGSPRLLYLPSLPIAFVVGLVLVRVFRSNTFRLKVLCVAALLLSLSLGGLHVRRALDFRDADQFWWAEAQANPQYFPAVHYFAVRALRNRRPREALELAHLGFSSVRTTYGMHAARTFFPLALVAICRLIPDLNQQKLGHVYTFLMDSQAGKSAEIDIPEFGLQMTLAEGSTDATSLRLQTGKLVTIEVGARIGRWQDVHGMAVEVLTTSTKSAVIMNLAMYAAQNHDVEFVSAAIHRLRELDSATQVSELEEALALFRFAKTLPEAKARPFRASFYTRVFAWGRAYRVLEKYTEAGGSLPDEIAEMVAEIAYRAGNEAQATSLLAPQGKAVIDQKIAEWCLSMQWTDAPLGVDELPLPSTLLARSPSR